MASSGSASQNRERFIGTEAFDAALLKFDPAAEREERMDGAISDDLSAYRERSRHTPDFPYSDLKIITAIFCSAFVHEEGQLIESTIDEHKRAGAPRKSRGFEAVAHETATSVLGSSRRVDRTLRDQTAWKSIRAATQNAWPHNPERWASSSPVNRGRRDHMVNAVYDTTDEADGFKRRCSNWICEIAKSVGMADTSVGTLTSPELTQVIVGDATWVNSRYNRTADDRHDIDYATAEIVRTRRHDPDTSKKHYNAKKAGQALVSAKIRSEHSHEWLVLDFEFLEPGRLNEGEIFQSMTYRLTEHLVGVRAIAYDMAISDAVVNDFLRAGLHPLVKVPRLRGGRPAAAHLGAHLFKHPKGSKKERTITVDAVDGCPVITVVGDGVTWAVPLHRVRTIRDERADGTFRVYGIWEIPDKPQVPESMAGLRTRIRHDSDPDDAPLRTRALRTIPENDRDWKTLFGTRNSVESMHSHYKALLPGGRFRNVGQRRRTINHCGYMLSRAVSTLLAYHHRTGADLEKWFGHWKPPDPKWWLSEEAA